MGVSFDVAKAQIIRAGQTLDQRGWVPATGGNLSARLNDGSVAITVSGRHKGYLVPDDIMRVDFDGQALDGKKPSAETLLHTGMYKIFPNVNAILHGHPRASVTYSLLNPADHIVLSGYELLKIYPGVKTHEASVTIPVFDNSQDMVALQLEIDRFYKQNPDAPPAYVVRGHGLTTGGSDMDMARYVFEATEELFAYELARMTFQKQ